MKLFHASIFLALILLFAKTTHAAQIRLKGDDPNLATKRRPPGSAGEAVEV